MIMNERIKILNSGIYIIKNIINNMFYIGSAINFQRRKYRHFHELKINKHHNIKLQEDYNKYGKDVFTFEILENIKKTENKREFKKILLQREQHYIDMYNAVENGYNINKNADSRYGTKQSEEAKKKISEHNKGRKMSEYNKKKLLEAHLGMKYSDEIKNKISNSLKNKMVGDKNPMYGKTHTKEVREKISNSKIGKKMLKEYRERLSGKRVGENNGFYGKNHSEQTKKTLSEKHKGLYVGGKSILSKKVICIELNTIFNSISEASVATNTNRGCISAVCKGKRKSAGGYTWKYTERKNK